MHEKTTVIVPASIPTTLRILQDVESMDHWIRPHLPSWPRIAATTEVVWWADDGVPELVSLTSSILGIRDTSLTEYEWSPDGYRSVLLESSVLADSATRVDLAEHAEGTGLTIEISAEFKIRLSGVVARPFERLQGTFRSALTDAIVAEAARVDFRDRHGGGA